MLRNAISLGRLMSESTDRIQSALQSDNSAEQLVAARVLENPCVWQQWESEHSALMRLVAVNGFRRTQVAILKRAALRLIERKALFEYLRERAVRGAMRRRIVAYFHPTRDYTHAIVAEHGLYLRKACSLLCASHVGIEVVHDAGFLDPMQRYEALYREYFQLFCDTNFDAESAPQADLLPLLKCELDERRQAIMQPAAVSQRPPRDVQRRSAARDTARLKTLTLPIEGVN